jgi:hypothetical protein
MKKEITATLEIDLEDFDKPQLIRIIMFAHEHDISFNEAMVRILSLFLESQPLMSKDIQHGDEVY